MANPGSAARVVGVNEARGQDRKNAAVDNTEDQTPEQLRVRREKRDRILAEGGQAELTLWVEDLGDGTRAHVDTVFHGRSEK